MELAIKYNKMSNNDLYDLTIKVRIITRTRMNDTLINFFKKNLEYITSEANKVYKNKTKEIFDAFDKQGILEGIEEAVYGNLFMMYDTSSAEETAYLDANEAEKIILLKIRKADYIINKLSKNIAEKTISYYMSRNIRKFGIDKQDIKETERSLRLVICDFADNINEEVQQEFNDSYVEIAADILEQQREHILDMELILWQ